MPIDKIRFLQRQYLEKEQLLQKSYFLEQIQHYGIDVEYYRANHDFFTDNEYSNWTMGQTQHLAFDHKEDMVVFTSVDVESTLTSALGIETSLNSEIYISKQEFTETWRDTIGVPKYYAIPDNTTIEINVLRYNGTFKHDVLTDDLECTTSSEIVIDPNDVVDGVTSGSITLEYSRIPLKVNEYLYDSPTYDTRYIDSSNIVCSYTGTLNPFGDGVLTFTLSGSIGFKSSYEDINNQPNNNSLRPIVGDFIRMIEYYQGEKQFDKTINYQEYTITHVTEQELTPNGYNNLINKYLYKCTIVRREASHEDVIGDIQEEDTIMDLIEGQERDVIIDTESNDIFDYASEDVDDIDTQAAKQGNSINNVFGGF
jgi:hypothetical protein